MNLLIDVPPDTVRIGDREYEIHSDFRVSILFELLMLDDDIEPQMKVAQAIELYFGVYPGEESVSDVLNAMIWFYRCGRADKEQNATVAKGPDKTNAENTDSIPEEQVENEMAYSFDYDDEYIYAAFLSQYGIDLTEKDHLHWWRFRALFKALDSDCQFAKIMGYRTAKITKDMSKTEKDYLRKMKKIHALPVSEKDQKEQNALAEALMNGGDVDALLGFSK